MLGCGADKDAALDKQYQNSSTNGSILQTLKSQGDLNTLIELLELTGLDDVLANEAQIFTVFAPTDAAFDKIPAAQLQALKNDAPALTQILLYHLIVGEEINAFRALKSAGNTQLSANGIKLFVNRELQNVFINGLPVVQADLKTTHGVVHKMDSVLVPPDLETRTLKDVKKDIIDLAQSYMGIDDADFTLQRTFEPLLAELLTLAEMPSVEQRLDLLSQPWKQIWGPYTYGSGQQGVDPTESADEVFQVVFKEGYYYNVTPLKNLETGAEQIGLLRGEFNFDPKNSQCLNVRFKRFPGVSGRPDNVNLWDLPVFEEAGTLEDVTGMARIEVVPTWVVQAFFGSGKLCELYTDDDLRITLSTDDDVPDRNQLYVLTKIQNGFTP